MKITFYFFSIFILLFACQDKDKIDFKSNSLKSETCDNCTKINVNLLKAMNKSKLAATINSTLNETVISYLLYDDDLEVSDIKTAMKSFESGYITLKEQYEDETTPWQADITSEVAFENSSLLTIELEAYIFTGGAHGYTTKQFLNFDKNKSVSIQNRQLFKDSTVFKNYAEDKFRVKEKIPTNQPINYTGFMFENDSFYLPENIGFTEKGLKLIYNQYEISSFADGTIELILPYKEVQKMLKLKIDH